MSSQAQGTTTRDREGMIEVADIGQPAIGHSCLPYLKYSLVGSRPLRT